MVNVEGKSAGKGAKGCPPAFKTISRALPPEGPEVLQARLDQQLEAERAREALTDMERQKQERLQKKREEIERNVARAREKQKLEEQEKARKLAMKKDVEEFHARMMKRDTRKIDQANEQMDDLTALFKKCFKGKGDTFMKSLDDMGVTLKEQHRRKLVTEELFERFQKEPEFKSEPDAKEQKHINIDLGQGPVRVALDRLHVSELIPGLRTTYVPFTLGTFTIPDNRNNFRDANIRIFPQFRKRLDRLHNQRETACQKHTLASMMNSVEEASKDFLAYSQGMRKLLGENADVQLVEGFKNKKDEPKFLFFTLKSDDTCAGLYADCKTHEDWVRFFGRQVQSEMTALDNDLNSALKSCGRDAPKIRTIRQRYSKKGDEMVAKYKNMLTKLTNKFKGEDVDF